jgi:hypothetical protein
MDIHFLNIVLAAAVTLTEAAAPAVPPTKESPPLIKPEEAGKHIYKRCTVEMKVRSSRLLRSQELLFLNSQKDFRDEKNFVAVVRGPALDALREKRIESPAEHFRNKKIRVTGRLELYEMKPQIVVEKLGQIKIVRKSRSGELYEVKAEDTTEDDVPQDEGSEEDDSGEDEQDRDDSNDPKQGDGRSALDGE